jgi:hypothetical protein
MLADIPPLTRIGIGASGGQIVAEDEALLRGVIEGLQRCCGRLVRGEDLSGTRAQLEAARRALQDLSGAEMGSGSVNGSSVGKSGWL